MKRTWGTAWVIVALVVVVSCTVVQASASTGPSSQHLYAGVYGTGASTGVDGYIRKSGTIMSDPAHQFHAAFINVCPTSTCSTNEWIQTGPFEGKLGTMAVATVVHRYRETNTGCGYVSADYGAPSAANYPYFISYVGDVSLPGYLGCGHDIYSKFAIRSGSITSAPVGYFYLFTGTIYPLAEEEVYAPNVSEDLGADYFGVDNSFAQNPGWGLHLLKSGAWQLWTAANEASASFANNPPDYTNLASFYSFRVTD